MTLKHKLIFSAFLMFLVPGLVVSQSPSSVIQANTPNFSGVWIFDRSTSLFSSKVLLESLTENNSWNEVFVIQQGDGQVKLNRHVLFEFINKSGKRSRLMEFEEGLILFLDGRGEKNSSVTGEAVNSVTTLKMSKLVSEIFTEPDKKGKVKRQGRMEFELSNGGKELVVSRSDFSESDDSMIRQAAPQNRRDHYHLQQ